VSSASSAGTAPVGPSLPAQLVEPLVDGVTWGSLRHLHLHMLVDLRRTFSRVALEEAAGAVLAAFPVLGCRYRRSWWRDRWVPARVEIADLVLVKAVAEQEIDEATRAWVDQPYDPVSEPPFRVAFFEQPRGGRLVISVHHMLADGAGALAVAHLLTAHLAGVAPRKPVSRERSFLQVARGLRCGDLPLLLTELVREGLQPLTILRVRRRDRRILPGSRGRSSPHWRTLELSEERARRFADRCKAAGATINDGLVAAIAGVAAGYTGHGPVAAGYTIDTRRYLAVPSLVVANLAGVALVVLPRRSLREGGSALAAAARACRSQKRRLPGLALNLLTILLLGWLPHGLIRRCGGGVLGVLRSYLERALAVTNIGSLDADLAPLGDDVVRASVLGPFLGGISAPILTVTGFRGSLTLHACDGSGLDGAGLESYLGRIERALFT